MQKYLHISKIFTTFAQDFNSGIYNNQNHLESMEKECIFRCQRHGRTYRVMAIPKKNASKGVMYFAYIGRRRLEPIGWYNKEFAIESVLCDAFGPNLWGEVKGAA